MLHAIALAAALVTGSAPAPAQPGHFDRDPAARAHKTRNFTMTIGTGDGAKVFRCEFNTATKRSICAEG